MRVGTKQALCLGLAGVLLAALKAPLGGQVLSPRAIAPGDFAIMAWGSSPSDAGQLYWMKQAGLNISGFCSVKDLDMVAAAGLACFVSDPRANGYDWTRLPGAKVLDGNIESLVRQIGNRPAALGFFLADEPRPRAFHGLGQVKAILAKAAPGKWAYVNLLPNYSPPDYLETTDYQAYLREYLDQVDPPLLSYDNYSLFDGQMLDRFYTNLETIRSHALAAHLPFWNVVLSSTFFGYMAPSEATLDLQVYATLAYGGRGIEYFTYFAPAKGNFRLAPVDPFGHRTPTWGMLQRVNAEVNALAPWLIRLHSTGVYYSPPVPAGLKPITDSALAGEVVSETSQNPPSPGKLLIGEFRRDNGDPYLMIVNRDLTYSVHYLIHLKDESKHLVYISAYSGKEESFGPEMDWLAPGGGALFRLAKK